MEAHKILCLTAVAMLSVGCARSSKASAPATFSAQLCVEGSVRGAADPSMLPLAFSEFSKACANGEHSACSVLGVMHEVGAATRQDRTRAVQLYYGACQGENVGGCMNLGRAYLHGIGVPKDQPRALQLLEWSCKRAHPVACRELGTMHLMGDGVAANGKLALGHYKAACDRGDAEGCKNLGALYEQGQSVEQDVAQALAAYEKACVHGQGDACAAAERIDRRSAEMNKARAALRQLPSEAACHSGNASECAATGLAYFRGDGVPRNVERAVGFLQQACSQGYEPSCTLVGPMLHGSCAKGNTDSCNALQRLAQNATARKVVAAP
jgi:TPR repeat protein